MKAVPQDQTEPESVDRITLHAFRATDNPDLCSEFLVEHRKVLEDFGVTHVSTNNDVWMHDPNCFVVVALHETLGMVAGVRLQLDHPDISLPMAAAVRPFDPRVDEVLERLRPFGNGEVCGLWNANRYNGRGMPALLGQAISAVAVSAGARKLVCFVAHYTQKYPARVGFVVMDELGDHGYFPKYPVPRIITIAMINPDTMLLEHATQAQRQLIYSLRLRPDQVRMEKPGNTLLEVHYQLHLNHNVLDLNAYRQIAEMRMREAV